MEQFRVRIEGDTFYIDGLPEDAVKIISFDKLLPGQSRELSSLSAHRLDLIFAKVCLDQVNATEGKARQAFWRAAVVYYCKCFSQSNGRTRPNSCGQNHGGGRKPLHPNKFLPAGLPREVHRYFMSLRNMHLVHDANDWLQALTGAVIASPDKGYNIEKVICTTFEGQSLVEGNFSNLSLLIDHALTWVNAEFEKICVHIKEELERIPRETLLAQSDVKYRAPEAGDIHLPHSST
jgi:hypothetical protein